MKYIIVTIDGHASMFGMYENDINTCITTILKTKTIIHAMPMFYGLHRDQKIIKHRNDKLQKTFDILLKLVQEDKNIVIGSCDYHGQLFYEFLPKELQERTRVLKTIRSGQMGFYEAVFQIPI
jgi:hypothetical protein